SRRPPALSTHWSSAAAVPSRERSRRHTRPAATRAEPPVSWPAARPAPRVARSTTCWTRSGSTTARDARTCCTASAISPRRSSEPFPGIPETVMAKQRTKDEQVHERIRESAHKIWLAGLGALAAAEQEGGKLFRSLVRKGEQYEEQGRERIEQLRTRVEELSG